MLVVETIAKIRLAYFSRKMTIKAICRDLRVSRKVVRKVIRSQATEFHYQRDVQPQPKIGPWRERLDLLLLENDGKPARERLTLIRVFEELRALGFEGGYDAVRDGSSKFVFDLMEPERPKVDRAVLDFVKGHVFDPADFVIRTDGVCRLNPEMARMVVVRVST